MNKYIDVDKLIAEIERRKNRIERRLDNIVPLKRKDTIDEEQLAKIELRDKVNKAYFNGVWITLSDVLSFITSLQQEDDKDSKEAAIQYRDSIFKRIEEKRVLPSFKGQLLHGFKNELNTMEQILGIKNWSDIQYALFEKFALVFATWGGYHFHPKETESEDSLQQEQPLTVESVVEQCKKFGGNPEIIQQVVDFDNEYKSYIESRKDDLSGNAITVNMKDLARHFYELGLNERKEK